MSGRSLTVVCVVVGFLLVIGLYFFGGFGVGQLAEGLNESDRRRGGDLSAVANPVPASRDAVAGQSMMASGAAIMPDDLAALDPSQYSVELARHVPVETGMEQFAAKDEFLVYYNSAPGPQTRVSMTEKTVNGATIFVIRRLGMADDSVSAEESYAVFDDGVLAAYGTRIKCHRSASPDAWATELCP